MDKLPILKQTLIDTFSDMFRKVQLGYPMQGYKDIREAMLAINMFDNYTIDSWKRDTIIDFYTRKLEEL